MIFVDLSLKSLGTLKSKKLIYPHRHSLFFFFLFVCLVFILALVFPKSLSLKRLEFARMFHSETLRTNALSLYYSNLGKLQKTGIKIFWWKVLDNFILSDIEANFRL